MKRLVLIFVIGLMCLPVFSQEKKQNSALLVIDIQDFYFPGGNIPLLEPELAAQNALVLIKNFREKGRPVIFIKHNYQPGGSINGIVKPLEGEKVISKDNANSFLDTDLDDYLKNLEIGSIVICGMQTHMCVEAATRAGSDLGYKCTVIDDACTTRDLKYNDKLVLAMDVHYSTLSTLSSYAKVMLTEEFIAEF